MAIYLTEPLVRGFTTAASLHVVVSQLKYLLGMKTQRFSGPFSVIYVSFNSSGGFVGGKGAKEAFLIWQLGEKGFYCPFFFSFFMFGKCNKTNYLNASNSHTVLFVLPQSLKAVLSGITSTNVTTLILGLVCFVFLYGVKDLNERFKKKLPIPIPGEIIVVIVSTGVSYGLALSSDYKVDVVGKISTG